MITVNAEVLAREGYTEVFDQNEFGEVTLRNDCGGFEVFAVRDSFSGWCIPTDCGKVLEFCRSAEVPVCPAGWDCIEGDDEAEESVDVEIAEDAEDSYGQDEIDFDDWTTEDGCKFYTGHGKLVLDATDMTDAQAKRAAARIMRADGFYPNVWYVSDHGNVSSFTF